MPPRQPIIRLDNSMVPLQINGPVPVGPAYRTFEEAFRKKARPNSHIAEVILYQPSGAEVARWWEVSSSVDAHGVGRAGDTEQKALVRVNLRKGYKLEIRGAYNPCTVKKGCDFAMQVSAMESGAEIIYRTYAGKRGTVHHYPKDDF